MGEDCDDGVRSLWHSCLHSLLYEHGQGGQSLVIDHYHDHGYDHHHHHNFHHLRRSNPHQHQIVNTGVCQHVQVGVPVSPWLHGQEKSSSKVCKRRL